MTRGRFRTLILAGFVALACLLGHEPRPAMASRPGHLVAIVAGAMSSCTSANGAVVAIDASGAIYVDCGGTRHFTRVAQVSGTPVSLTRDSNTAQIYIGMDNGDIYTIDPAPTPYSVSLLYGNVFTP